MHDAGRRGKVCSRRDWLLTCGVGWQTPAATRPGSALLGATRLLHTVPQVLLRPLRRISSRPDRALSPPVSLTIAAGASQPGQVMQKGKECDRQPPGRRETDRHSRQASTGKTGTEEMALHTNSQIGRLDGQVLGRYWARG